MARAGGFFKRLKAKEKRASSRKQRGTKGASKEERRRKHNERVELYSARREAEQLAAVSSSSDDEPSTDSDVEDHRQTASLRRLQRMLGVTSSSDSQAVAHKRARQTPTSASHHKDIDNEEGGTREGVGSSSNSDSDSDSDTKVNTREFSLRSMETRLLSSQQRRRARREGVQKRDRVVGAADDGDFDNEDWRLYLRGVSGSEDASESADDALDADDEEVEELGEETDDADDLVDKDLLMDIEDEEDEEGDNVDDEEGSEGAENPLFDLENNSGPAEEVDDDDDGADLFDDALMMDDGESEEGEEEEEEEEGESEAREDPFVDDEDDVEGAGSTAASSRTVQEKNTQTRLLLKNFELNTSSVSILQRCGAVGGANGAKGDAGNNIVFTEKDEWMRKYHLDLHGEPDTTPLRPHPVPHAAVELLAEANRLLQARAAKRLEESVDKKELGIFFSSPEECAAVHPENVAVLATAHAQKHLLHAPFDVRCPTVPSPSLSAPQTLEPWAECPPYLHPVLWDKWTAFRKGRDMPTLTAEERGLLDLVEGYSDLLDTLHCWQNSESRREIFALHLLNHWFKARSVVLAHDALLAQRRAARRRLSRRQGKNIINGTETRGKASPSADKLKDGEQMSSPSKRDRRAKSRRAEGVEKTCGEANDAQQQQPEEEDVDVDEQELELRDRGFSKTRLCVVCPLRNHAYKFVYTLVSILQADPSNCPKLAMFEQDFTEIEEAVDPTFRRRPRDYQRCFEGNIDDSFCVGLRLEPDRVHVYSHPLNSDVLLCSPLGLRRRIERNGDVLVSLSSIEVCLVEDAHMLFQQNWAHVTAVLQLLNKRPTDTTHGLSDLRRVYGWALEGHSGRHRQTIMMTDVCNALMLSTFRTSSVNNSGKLLLQRRADPGVLSRVLVPVRQHFIRFDPSSLTTVDDDRFEFFTKQVYGAKINAMAERDIRVIIFIPSYFDFVRVRNYFHREYRESYVALSEYTSLKQQRKALGQFSDLERPVLLVTERFYYFKRYFVKLAEALVFYSPPMFPEYYASLTNKLVSTSPNAFAMTLYCRYDTHELNRLVGTSRTVQLLERESGVFSFVTS